MRQTADGPLTLIASGFTALKDSEPSEGRGPRVSVGSFTQLDEAIEAAAHMGVQGDSGYVLEYKTYLAAGGLIVTNSLMRWDRRKDENGFYTVGPVNEGQEVS